MNYSREFLQVSPPSGLYRDHQYGIVTGVVTNLDDPDSKGKIKVKFPWLPDEVESQWARVTSFMTGSDRGAFFRPEVDDEVVVAFEKGDVRFPIILGSLWNGQDAAPEECGSASAENNIRMIKSRSGHKIIFDDTSGSEVVTIEDKNGNIVEMSNEGVVIKSDTVKIGSKDASEALVLGTAFMDLFNRHTHPTGVGPSGVPVEPMQDGAHISSNHKTQ
jgi:uncharacterized protein involved in type VI secretion and phage assembly